MSRGSGILTFKVIMAIKY